MKNAIDLDAIEARYRRDGFAVIENLAPPDLLRGLQSEVARVVAAAGDGELTGDGHYDIVSVAGNRPALRRIADPEETAEVFAQAIRCQEIVDVVARLLGGGVRFDHAKLNFKPPGGGGALGWHQDFAFYPQTNDDMLAVGLMIEDCGGENGPLAVIPGSHRGPIFDHHKNGVFTGLVAEAQLNGAHKNAVEITAPAGSISIHHARTLHASGENKTARDRPLLLLNYFAVDAFPIFHGCDWDSFNARIVRGAPPLAPRYAPVDCKVPHPAIKPGDRHTTASIYDLQKNG